MRVSAQALMPAGAAAPPQAGLQAAGEIGFAALLAAALPPPDISGALASVPLTAEPADTPVEEAQAEEPDLAGLTDPSLLALLPDAATLAPQALRLRPATEAPIPASDESKTTDGLVASLQPSSRAVLQDLPAPSAADRQAAPVTPVTTVAPDAHHAASAGATAAESPAFTITGNANPPWLPADPSAGATSLQVAAPLSSARWNSAFGEQVVWMAQKDMQVASLTLNPPDLGPVKIELKLHDTQAVASFSSAQPEVRKAIEDALPALKTLFADAGLDLRQADVGSGNAQSSHSRHAQDNQAASRRDAHPAAPVATMEGAAPLAARRSVGLLDTFA